MKKTENILAAVFGLLAILGLALEESSAQGFRGGPGRGDGDSASRGGGQSGGGRDFRGDGYGRGGYGRGRGGFRPSLPPQEGDGLRGDGRGGFPPRRPGGGGPGFGPPGMSPGASGGPPRYEMFFQRLDANGDGRIDPKEVEGPMRFMYEGMARRAGLDPAKSITLKQLREAMASRVGQREGGPAVPLFGRADGDSSDSKGPKGPKAPEQEPLVAGFELAQTLPPVPGFGVRVAGGTSGVASNSSKGKSDASSSSTSEKSRTEYKVRSYAKGVIKKYDRDDSGSLEKHEWSQMRSDPKLADRNNDGVITQEELTVRFLQDRLGRSSGGLSDSGGFGSRKSYRFLTALERLPEGLPDWFADKDANADGQVAMHEYAGSWSDSTAREFAGYDADNDGVITPKECLEAGSRPSEPVSMSVSRSAPPSASVSDSGPASVSASEPEPKQKQPSGGGDFWWTR